MTPPTPTGHFFSRRWRGQVPLRVVFWRDVVLVGSALNLTTTFAALMLAASGVGVVSAALVHFAPLPYNLFLAATLWRTPPRAPITKGVGMVWLVVLTLV